MLKRAIDSGQTLMVSIYPILTVLNTYMTLGMVFMKLKVMFTKAKNIIHTEYHFEVKNPHHTDLSKGT